MKQPRVWQREFKKALIVEHPDLSLDGELRKLGIEPHRLDTTPTEEDLVKILSEGGHDLIYKRSRVLITENVVKASPNLAAVMLCCIGDDSVDKEACARHGVMVTNDPVSNGRSVAELVISELIAGSRRIVDSVNEMSESVWKKNNKLRFEVMGKTLGILGLGKIGRQVAQLAEALDMDVLFFDTDEIAVEVGTTLGWEATESMEDLFTRSDVITVHVSATDIHGRSNEGLLDYEAFSHLSGGREISPRIFINLARGFLFDPDDLKRAVEDGHVGYAFVDVFPDEPRQSDDSAWRNPYEHNHRILATPHIGAATLEAQPRIARYVSRTTAQFAHYGAIRNCVFMPKANIGISPANRHVLAVLHADKRGTKKAIADSIYAAGVNNLESIHVDFPKYGIAYELSALDRALTEDELGSVVEAACSITGDESAVRAIRMFEIRA